MNFQPETIYHIYNRGNQQRQIFFKRDNYIYFLEKLRKYVVPRCDILCWCLMPNHFHLLAYTTEQSVAPLQKSNIPSQHLTEGIRLLLSSYAKGIQKQERFTGNLFQQKTKAKCVSDKNGNYALTSFHYVHQNPFNAKLVKAIEDWEFSSFLDYLERRRGTICNKELAIKVLGLDMRYFYEESYNAIPENDVKNIFEDVNSTRNHQP